MRKRVTKARLEELDRLSAGGQRAPRDIELLVKIAQIELPCQAGVFTTLP